MGLGDIQTKLGEKKAMTTVVPAFSLSWVCFTALNGYKKDVYNKTLRCMTHELLPSALSEPGHQSSQVSWVSCKGCPSASPEHGHERSWSCGPCGGCPIRLTWTLTWHKSFWLSKQFVHQRVDNVEQFVPSAVWQHISTFDNPADMLTRGTNASNFCMSSHWLKGLVCLNNCTKEHICTDVFNAVVSSLLPEVLDEDKVSANCIPSKGNFQCVIDTMLKDFIQLLKWFVWLFMFWGLSAWLS